MWKGDAVKAEYTAAQGVLTAISIEVSKKKGSANGIVETIDLEGKTFAVSAKTVHVSERTEFRLGEKKMVFADLIAGDQVSVTGYVYGGENSLLASAVKVKRTAAVVKGNVTSVDLAAKAILLGELKVVVADDAKLHLNGKPAVLADIMPGDKVVATGQKTGEVFTAKVVSVQREAVKWEGTIESIDAALGTLSLGGKTVKVTEATEIEKDEQPVTLAELAVGNQVEVKALQQGETWLALKIQVKEDEDENEVEGGEVEGKVETIDATALTLTINGKKVQVTKDTEIKAEKQKGFSFADIKVGHKAEAKGTWKDGVLMANELKIENEDD